MRKQGIWVSFHLILLILSLFCINTYAAGLDSAKYISLDEIQADMEAYCLTVFSGMEVERFPLKVLSVVRGQQPGQDIILVLGTDERFQHAGAIHGCSGSPVYIDGRLAGALASGWDGSLDALYMVRPIEDMLKVGEVESPVNTSSQTALQFDLSGPLNLADVYQQAMGQLEKRLPEQTMLIPLSSSLPSQACDLFRGSLRQMGLVPVSAPAAIPMASDATDFEAGGVLAAVLCGGDITLAATGTVTAILGDQLYGFGHGFKGQGPTNLPIAAGIVHSVVANRNSSFKFSSPGPILGTLEFDQSFGVRGTIGATPKTIPLTIRVDRDNAAESQTYDCHLAIDRMYTPLILQLALNGAATLQGPLPPEHTVRYEAQVHIKGQDPLILKNVTSGQGTSQIEQNLYAISSLSLNNPFEALEIESIDAKIDITSEDRSVDFRGIDVSRTEVKPGETVTITATMMSFRSKEFTTDINLKVPETLAPGKYTIQVMGGSNYQRFVASKAPQRFRAFDMESLAQALHRVTAFRNDGLYAVMQVPASGIVLQQHELPQLPQTKMLLMQDTKRLRPIAAYQDWVESRAGLDKVVQGGAEIEITVKQ